MGDYIVRSDVEDVFGVSNVSKWGDLDNDGAAGTITARINKAIDYAESVMNARFRDSRYVVPLTGYDNSEQLIITIAATLAGAWLYWRKGIQDDELSSKIALLVYGDKTTGVSGVEQQMSQILAGQLKLDASLNDSSAPTGAVVV